MVIKDWKAEVFTIPNILSTFRLVLIPVYMTIYLNATEPKDYLLAALILALSCLTDMADGQIARRFHMISTLGKILDPIADKATQFTLTLCLSIQYPVLRMVLSLFIIKELFQAIVGVMHLKQGKMLPGALMAGKICTTVQFVSLILLVLVPQLPAKVVSGIAVMDTLFLLWSFVAYYLAYYGKHIKVEDIKKDSSQK